MLKTNQSESTAAKLFITELKSTKFEMTNYPSNEMIKDIEYNKAWLPELLQMLLEFPINNSLRQATIGQSIAYAARPRSVLPPILFGSGTELDHVFGSQWLLTEQNHLGYCVSPDKILCYKQSVVMNETTDDLLNLKQGSFCQWSADNIDHLVGRVVSTPWESLFLQQEVSIFVLLCGLFLYVSFHNWQFHLWLRFFEYTLYTLILYHTITSPLYCM